MPLLWGGLNNGEDVFRVGGSRGFHSRGGLYFSSATSRIKLYWHWPFSQEPFRWEDGECFTPEDMLSILNWNSMLDGTLE